MSFIRDPRISFLSKEIAWYENEDGTLIGVISIDRIDKDFSAVIFKRCKSNNFEFEDCVINLPNKADSEKWLFSKATELETAGDLIRNNSNLFSPLYKENKLHLYFKALMDLPQYSSARNLLKEIVPHFYDVDGNFLEQFQTTGFDSRLWEIYLLCYFNEEFLRIDRSHNAPDFLLSNSSMEISLEAVTISKKGEILPFADLIKQTDKYIQSQNSNDVPLMYGSAIYDKIKPHEGGLRYWEFPHTLNKPFVIAIADFHEESSMSWSMEALATYLYGEKHIPHYDADGKLTIEYAKIKPYKKKSGTEISAGFFLDSANENVSAVLHSTCGTLAKFNRIGKQCGFDEENTIMNKSVIFHNPDPNVSTPLITVSSVNENSKETWSEGISVYHNPYAKFPLPFDFFPSAAHHFIKDGIFTSILPDMHVYSITTLTTSEFQFVFG